MYFQSLPHSDPALLHIITTLSQHTLNTLHLHGFHTYLEHLKPEDIVPIFLPIYQFLSPASQERYREITTSSSWKMFPESVSVPPPTNHSFISSSSSLILSLASRIFSCSASPTNTFIPKIGRSKKNICKIRSRYVCPPGGRSVLSSTTQTLPYPILLPLWILPQNVFVATISVITWRTVSTTDAHIAKSWCWDILHVFVFTSSAPFVSNGAIFIRLACNEYMDIAINQDMSQTTVHLWSNLWNKPVISLVMEPPYALFDTLKRHSVLLEPGAQMYTRNNVTIYHLRLLDFLLSIC